MPERPLQAELLQKITGYWVSQAIFAAAKLGLADLLQACPQTATQLAEATQSRPDWLYRLLRALASEGIFTEDEQQRFALTPLAELLRSDVPGSQRALALMMADEHYEAWGQLAHVLRSGENAFEKLYGAPVFDYLGQHPEKAEIFDAAMTGINGRETGAILESYDFSGIAVLADIGGGNGSNIIEVLKRYPNMRGILFDLPHVVDRARPQIEAAGLADRCQIVAGSFFESVPAGADAYLMRHIIHDWDDEKSLTILKNCSRAMTQEGRLLVLEAVIPSGNGPFGAKFLDLNMLILPGGKERTEKEYRDLFTQSGFQLSRVVRSRMEISVVEGQRTTTDEQTNAHPTRKPSQG